MAAKLTFLEQRSTTVGQEVSPPTCTGRCKNLSKISYLQVAAAGDYRAQARLSERPSEPFKRIYEHILQGNTLSG